MVGPFCGTEKTFTLKSIGEFEDFTCPILMFFIIIKGLKDFFKKFYKTVFYTSVPGKDTCASIRFNGLCQIIPKFTYYYNTGIVYFTPISINPPNDPFSLCCNHFSQLSNLTLS